MPAGRYRQAAMAQSIDQLAVLKALGDETRYAMYRELARSTAALSAQDLAEALGIHANTVRLHLERLREVGLVDVEAVHRGTVGRPQHLYFLSAGAPGLPLEGETPAPSGGTPFDIRRTRVSSTAIRGSTTPSRSASRLRDRRSTCSRSRPSAATPTCATARRTRFGS